MLRKNEQHSVYNYKFMYFFGKLSPNLGVAWGWHGGSMGKA